MAEERKKTVDMMPWLEQLDAEVEAVESSEQKIKTLVGQKTWDDYVQHRNAVSSFVKLITYQLKKVEKDLDQEKKAEPKTVTSSTFSEMLKGLSSKETEIPWQPSAPSGTATYGTWQPPAIYPGSESTQQQTNAAITPPEQLNQEMTRTDVLGSAEKMSYMRRGSSVDHRTVFGPVVTRRNRGKQVYRQKVIDWFQERKGTKVTVEEFVSYWNKQANNDLQPVFLISLWSTYVNYLYQIGTIGEVNRKNRFIVSATVSKVV